MILIWWLSFGKPDHDLGGICHVAGSPRLEAFQQPRHGQGILTAWVAASHRHLVVICNAAIRQPALKLENRNFVNICEVSIELFELVTLPEAGLKNLLVNRVSVKAF